MSFENINQQIKISEVFECHRSHLKYTLNGICCDKKENQTTCCLLYCTLNVFKSVVV